MLQLVALENTILKKFPIDSKNLPTNQKQLFAKDSRLIIQSYEEERNHLRLRSPGTDEILYAYCRHIKIVEAEKTIYPPATPEKVKLSVPYKSQRDNWYNPSGSCNVTSIAMCLGYFGVKPADAGQLEDELYEYCLNKGYSRHSPHDLARVVRDYGLKDRFSDVATMDELKLHLKNGNPAVIHGYFTSYGHIVCCVGYDDSRHKSGKKDGLIIHDPWGEWFDWGYSDSPGDYLNYSYDMIRQLCCTENQFWVHFISK